MHKEKSRAKALRRERHWKPRTHKEREQASLLQCDAGHEMTSDVGIPWRLSGKEPACQAGGTGLIPDPGRPHVPRSHRACITATTEPVPQGSVPARPSLCFATSEAATRTCPQLECSPAPCSCRKACTAQTQHSQKYIHSLSYFLTNLSSNAEDTSLIPGLRTKIPYAV